MRVLLYLIIIFIVPHFSQAQSFAINIDGSTANSSAMLDIKSTTRGLLIPRLSKTEKNAVTAPATGLLIYQTGPDSSGFYYYQNSRWNWITDNHKSDSSYWSLHGNNNTTPPAPSNNAPINYATDTYLGTYQPEDVSFIAGGNELLRLKQVSQGGMIGLSNRSPEYGLDMRLSDPNPQTDIVGMRIISSLLFDFNNSNLNKGLVMGNNRVNANETVIWNHGNNIDASIRIGFDLFNSTIRPALNLNQYGQGIYQRNPKYALDIHSRSQFAPATTSTNKNGMRITYLNQENQNQEDRGLFMGVDVNNSYKSYLWNYADGQGGNAADRAIYFGVGGDMDLSNQRATMELQDGKIIMGRITDPTFFFPSTLNIQTDYTSGVAKNGMSIMKHMVNGVESAYFGTDGNDNLNIYKYGGGNVYIGAPFDNPLTINSNNYVGIKTVTPNAELQFGDTYANNRIVLHNNFHGNIPGNEHDFYGFGVNDGLLRYQVPRNTRSHVFYAGDINGTASNELMRITGNGYVGINNNNPQAPLEFNSGQENRKIVLAGFGNNNDHNFFGFGRNNGELRYQVAYGLDDQYFYKGNNDGFSSTELLRILGSGDIGVGTNFPVAYGHAGTNRIVEIKNSLSGAADVQSHLILSTFGQSGSLGGVTWAGLNLTGEQRTGFIGNIYETANQTKLSFHTRSNTGVLAERFYIQGDGNAWLQGTLTQASDARLKHNIKPLSSVLDKLDKINGYTYNWINDQKDTEEQVGLLAQEVQKNYPQLVKQNDQGELSVNYSGLIPVLLEGIKEQKKQIETLKKQNLQQQLQIESILKKIK
ncbi:MAG: tail fiber domain-containing protein [Chitinophagaceae bacterium]|nr:tail fiber domain-containing protein [Chitinophagaceae bacterium]